MKKGIYGGKRKDLTEHLKYIKRRAKILSDADKEQNSGPKQLKLPLDGKV